MEGKVKGRIKGAEETVQGRGIFIVTHIYRHFVQYERKEQKVSFFDASHAKRVAGSLFILVHYNRR